MSWNLLGTLVLFSAGAYILGSVNFSILVLRIAGKRDPREGYSGNAGVTNVYRQQGIFWAAVILLLDAGRSVALAWFAMLLLPRIWVPCPGLFLIAGTRFPLFHGFRGGKGVANYLGFCAVLFPVMAVASCALWVGIYALAKKPFIASFFMVAVLCAGEMLSADLHPAAVAGSIATAVFIITNHAKNIKEAFRKENGSSSGL